MRNSTSWTVRVEWPHTDASNLAEDEVDEILDALEGLGPALGFTYDGDRMSRISATITLEATSLRQAFAAAVKAVEYRPSVRPDAVEVLPTEEFDRRLDEPTIPELVGLADIARMAGVSRQRAAQLADLDGFPPAVVTVGSGGGLRVKSQVDLWLEGWERRSGRPRKSTLQGG